MSRTTQTTLVSLIGIVVVAFATWTMDRYQESSLLRLSEQTELIDHAGAAFLSGEMAVRTYVASGRASDLDTARDRERDFFAVLGDLRETSSTGDHALNRAT